jgi:cephalosporin hydroxylase
MNPEGVKSLTDYRNFAFHHTHLRKATRPLWKGRVITKYATDMVIYAEMIYAFQPNYIVEAGTSFGGSALFFADMLGVLCGGGKVITIDVGNRERHDGNIRYIRGSSIDPGVVQEIKNRVGGSVMVSLDSKHTFEHVKSELLAYRDIVTSGQFMVVEDSYARHGRVSGPGKAVHWFLEQDESFVREYPEARFLISVTREGWLRKL